MTNDGMTNDEWSTKQLLGFPFRIRHSALIRHSSYRHSSFALLFVIAALLALPTAALAAAPAAPPGPINMEFRDTDLPTVLRAICQGAGLDFVLDPSVQGKVTAKLRNTSWENALDIILKSHNLVVKRQENTLLISPAKETGAPAAGQRKVVVAARPDGKFDFDSSGAEVRDAVTEFGKAAKLNIVVSKDTIGSITASLHGLPANEMLNALADCCGAAVAEKGNVVHFGPKAATLGVGPSPGALAPEGKAPPPTEVRRLPDGRLAIHARDVPIRQLLSQLAAAAGLNIVSAQQLTGTISLDLEGVSTQEAIDAISSQTELVLRPAGGILYASSAPPVLQTESFRLRCAKAKDIGDVLTQTLTGIKIGVEPGNNLLIISGPAEVLATARQIVKQIEIPPTQVTIETRIVETNLTGEENLGVEWIKSFAVNLTSAKVPSSFPATSGTASGGIFPSYDPTNALTRGNSAVPFAKPEDFQFGFLSTSALNVVLNFLQERTKARLLACPLITTVENQKAKINIVTKFPIATYQVSSESGLLTISGFEYKEFGTILEVTPRVSDGYILLDVHPEISRQAGTTVFQGAELPIIASEETWTQVRVKDGDTLVIAGLIREESQQSKSWVPLLGDIPLIGGIFRNNGAKVSERSNLLIFITPHIVGANDFTQSAALKQRRTQPLSPLSEDYEQ